MKLADSVFEELWFAEDDIDSAEDEASRSLAAKLAEVDGLKTFPLVAQRVMSILGNKEFRMLDLTKALEEDPGLAANLMRMANSAFFAGSKALNNISLAVTRLGTKTTSELVATVATMGMFPDSDGLGQYIRDHNAATAAIVQALAREFAPGYSEGIFLAGLMHDVGKLLLLESGEVMYASSDVEKFFEADQIHIAERSTLGYDHAVLGGHVMQAWKIPEPIPKIVAWHHQPSRAYQDSDVGTMVALLRIADRIEGCFRTGLDGYEDFINSFAKGPDCGYVGISAEQLSSKWELLYQAREDALSLFGKQVVRPPQLPNRPGHTKTQ